MEGIGEQYLTEFSKSVFEINTNSTKFNLYSQNNMVLNDNISLEWAENGAKQYANLFAGSVMVSSHFSSRYSNIVANFDDWKAEADAVYGAE